MITQNGKCASTHSTRSMRIIGVALTVILSLSLILGVAMMASCGDDTDSERDLCDNLIYTKNDTGYTVELFALDVLLGYGSTDEFCEANADTLSITKLTIPDTYNGEPVTEIGDYAFAYCGITELTIPTSIRKIGSCAFIGCTALSEIHMPDALQVIGDRAFADCTSVSEFIMPKQLGYIGSSAFSGCTALKAAYYQFSEGLLVSTVRIHDGNYALNRALCYYSEGRPYTSGSYWHYDTNGNPTMW